MIYFKTALFFAAGAFLGLTPLANYYFTHGPSCPCHSLLNTGFYWTAPGSRNKEAADERGENARPDASAQEAQPSSGR